MPSSASSPAASASSPSPIATSAPTDAFITSTPSPFPSSPPPFPPRPSLGLHAEFGLALAGNLFSPARGLFVYSPLLLLTFLGLAIWFHRPQLRPLALFIAAASVLQLLLVSSYEDWSGGHCYGPRYLSDPAGLLVLPLVAVSLFLHSQGAFCVPCSQWNYIPTETRASPHRLWDWSDPPFLS